MMTYQEALALLNDMEFKDEYQGKDEYTSMLIKCKEALVKQIPKKPVENLWDEYYECPVCGGAVSFQDEKCDFCPDCGQAIEWK